MKKHLTLTILLAFAALALPASTLAQAPSFKRESAAAAAEFSPLIEAMQADEPRPAGPRGKQLTLRGSGGICPTAGSCWINGPGTYQYFENCVIGGYGYVYSYVGYWGNDDFSYPAKGDRYWGHIVSGVVGSACGGEYIGTDVQLPDDTSFDIDGSAEGRIRCFYTSGKTGNTEEITDNPQADCRQNPGAGVWGGYGLGGRVIPAYGTFEVIFPVKSSKPNLAQSKLRAAIDTALSTPDVAYPEAAVVVADKADPGPGPGPDPEPEPSSLTASLSATSQALTVSGAASPARSAGTVTAELFRNPKKGKPFRSVATKSKPLAANSTYRIPFARPNGGRCRVEVSLPAAAGFTAASKTVAGRC